LSPEAASSLSSTSTRSKMTTILSLPIVNGQVD
jgi:hypothetical protein